MSAIIFTPGGDPNAGRIIEALGKRGIPCGIFDMAQPASNGVTIGVERGRVSGAIRTAQGRFDLNDVHTFYGHFLSLKPPQTEASMRLFTTEEWMSTLGGLYMATRDRLWVNPFESYLVGESKLFQVKAAALAGLATPDSMVSNEAADLAAFARARDQLALKRVSHPFPRLAVSGPPEWVLYTQRIPASDLTVENLADANVCPVHIQDYVDKRVEVRAYVVGEKVLAAEIHSQDIEETKVDWRHYPMREEKGEQVVDTDRWRCRRHELPRATQEALLRTARAMGMVYAAIDLIVTPKGEYVFLEANAAGAFGFAEDLAGLPISEAFASLAIERT